MIAIVDYGVGNLFSLESSFAALGAATVVTGDPEVLRKADRIILPGVGAFGDAAAKLRKTGLGDAVCGEARRGKLLLGICLGMQMLLEESLEFGRHKGLGLLPGQIVPIANVIPVDLKIPQIGWNALRFPKDKPVCPLFSKIREGDHVYFVHSYYAAAPADCVAAVTEYGADLTAAVHRDNVYGCQFHPEKSGKVGLSILNAFLEVKA